MVIKQALGAALYLFFLFAIKFYDGLLASGEMPLMAMPQILI